MGNGARGYTTTPTLDADAGAERVDLDTVTIKATSRRIVFRGVCGQKFSLGLDDWAALQREVAKAIRAAQGRATKGAI